MVELRTIEQIQEEYFDALVQSGSDIVIDRIEGSLAYTFSRASAVIASRQELLLQQAEASLGILSASGSALDRAASAFLSRSAATKAKGTVLAQSDSEDTVVPFGTELINLQTGEKYITLAAPFTTVYSSLETLISVEAINSGALANLASGTVLYAPAYTDISFVVGSQRYDNLYRGDIAGGQDAESDELYRLRVIRYFALGPTSTESNLLARLLQYPLVQRAFVKTRSPGIVEVWVDSEQLYTQSQIQEIYTYIRPYLTAGVIPMLAQAVRKVVDINVEVVPFRAAGVDLNSLSNQIRSVVESYINSLGLEDKLVLSQILTRVRPLVRSAKITAPLTDVLPELNEIIVAGVIRVSYPVN